MIFRSKIIVVSLRPCKHIYHILWAVYMWSSWPELVNFTLSHIYHSSLLWRDRLLSMHEIIQYILRKVHVCLASRPPLFLFFNLGSYNTQKKKNGVFHKPRNKKTRPENEARYMLSKVQWDIKPGYWVVMRATIFCTYWIVYICSQRAERCPVSSVLSWLVQWHSPTLHIHVSQNVGKN